MGDDVLSADVDYVRDVMRGYEQMTLEIYAHVLPDMQREAAETIGAILSGKVR